MNVTNFANLFHQNIFQQNKPLGQKLVQPTASDALNRLSENLLTAQSQAKDLKARFDTVELSAEAAEKNQTAGLTDAPEELLHFLLSQYKVGANLSQGQEASLKEYRDQLSAFDQTIQEYQDMLDGRAALPGQMKREDVSMLLEVTKVAREQFLQQGAKKLNQLSKEFSTQDGYWRKMYHMASDGKGGGQNGSGWQIDASAGDIYAEIDRALASARKVTSTFQEGVSAVLAELKRRGCVQAGEEFSLDSQDAADSGASGRLSLFQSIYDEIWSTFRQGVKNLEEES